MDKTRAKKLDPSVRLQKETFAIGFAGWKHGFIEAYFPERRFRFLPLYPRKGALKDWMEHLGRATDPEVFIWGSKCPADIKNLLDERRIPAIHVEDGFLRSKRPSASRTAPLSLTLDRQRPYFDCHGASDLEALLMNATFDAETLGRARTGIDGMLARGISKYNGPPGAGTDVAGPERRGILVIGQVEEDASIRLGLDRPMSNNDLVRLAARENPDAEIVYRPHPDVLTRVRARGSDPAEVAHLCRLETSGQPISGVLGTVRRVYTMTSLVGFEALLRGIPVTVVGLPFYAGWGLTDDRQVTTRRRRKLTVEELFAGAYILYPRYFDPRSGQSWTFEEALGWLSEDALEADSGDLVSQGLHDRPRWTMVGPYGVFGWRHALTPLLARIIRSVGNEDDECYFRSNPIRFFRETGSPVNRLVGQFLYPFRERTPARSRC
jgi:capsular polysaccharide export protein